MELTRLSQITGDLTYFHTALRVQELLSQFEGEYGSLVPHFLDSDEHYTDKYAIGGMTDRWAHWHRNRNRSRTEALHTAIMSI